MSDAWIPFQPAIQTEGLDRHADVLFFATGVGEAEVNKFDLLLLDQLQYVVGCLHEIALQGKYE